ncbi:outer membrane beta-barrel protein [Gillisia hiemivivida]
MFFFLLNVNPTHAQDASLSVKVLDSLVQQPIELVSVVLETLGKSPSFKSTALNGSVSFINLSSGQAVKVRFLRMGYLDKVIDLTLKSGENLIVVNLTQNLEQLDNVVLDFKQPIIVKRDTVIFQADAFTQGNENKLRDLLKRMPGLEVDKSGNVTLNGKSVERLFVEGKLFFTGNERLGVNNIPADAVEEVQLLDNFTDVAMLKKFEDTDELIMNLILKEDKKQLLFGDVAAGVGYKDRYKVNPALFYFSPEYSLNFIGDFNNAGQKSFTRKDYLDLNGGIRSMSPTSYFELSADEFSRFLSENDNTQAVHRLGAGSYRRSWKKTDLNSYVIFDDSDLEQESTSVRRYLGTEPFNENRDQQQEKDFSFLITKTALEYKPNTKTDVRSVLFFKTNSSDESGNIQSTSPFQNTLLQTNSSNDGFELNLDTQITREIDAKNTIISELKLKANQTQPEYLWTTNRPLVDQVIPYEPDDPYRLIQQVQSENYQMNFYAKHYYSINKKEQLHATLVFNQYATRYENNAFQQLTDGSINSFADAGFNVNTTRNITLANGSLEYRYKDNDWTIKPTLVVDYIYQNINQRDGDRDINNILLLPKAFAKYRITNTSSFVLNYDRNVDLPSTSQLVNRNFVSGLTSVSSGNPDLGLLTRDNISLSYNYANLWKGTNFKIDLDYNIKNGSFKPVTNFNGVDQIRNFIRLERSEDQFSYGGSYKKRLGLISSQVKVNNSIGNGFQIINNQVLETKNRSTLLGANVFTLYDKFPNLFTSFFRTYSSYENSIGQSDFIQDQMALTLDTDFLQHWNLEFNYTYNYFKGIQTGTRSNYDDANFKLSYLNEDSRWSYDLRATNLFDNEFKQNNSVSDYVITDTRTFILPRIFMITVSYKL